MLESIRKLAKSKVFKLLFGILIISFAFSGLAGISADSFSSNHRLQVGDEKIFDQEINQRYDQIVRSIRRGGKDFNEEQLAQMGVSKPAILRKMVNESMVRQEVADLGIDISEKAAAEEIRKTPQFQTEGEFDKEKFQNAIDMIGQTEPQFIAGVKNDLKNNLLMATVAISAPLNDFVAKKNAEIIAQTRELEIITIPNGAKKFDKKPTDKDLEEFFFENSFQFQIPETRDVTYFTIKKTKDNEAEIYDLSNQIDDELAGGATMEEVSKELDLKLEKIEGLEKENDKFSEAFTKTVFGGKLDESSSLVEDKDGEYFVVHVDKIEESSIPELKEVKDDVALAWVQSKEVDYNEIYAGEVFKELKGKKDVNFKQFAAQNKFKYETLGSLKIDAAAVLGKMVSDAFEAKQGAIKGAYAQPDGSYRIVRVTKVITPEITPEILQSSVEQNENLASNEIMAQYFDYLKDKYPVKENKNIQKQQAPIQ